MVLPWLQIADALIGLTNLARTRKPAAPEVPPEVLAKQEARLALEREQLEAERQRAERVLRLERRRQAGDREIGRLRWLAGFAVVSWIGTLVFAARLIGSRGSRVALGAGWFFLLAGIAASFVAQSRVARSVERDDDGAHPIESGAGGALAPWLVVMGLALAGLAALM